MRGTNLKFKIEYLRFYVRLLRKETKLLTVEQNVQECDATEDDSSTEDGYMIIKN